jgi:hypothetical protein
MLLWGHIIAVWKNSWRASLVFIQFSYQSKIAKFCSLIIVNENAIRFNIPVQNNSLLIFMYLLQSEYNIFEPFPYSFFLNFFSLFLIGFNLFLNVGRAVLHYNVESTWSPLINKFDIFYYVGRWHRCQNVNFIKYSLLLGWTHFGIK